MLVFLSRQAISLWIGEIFTSDRNYPMSGFYGPKEKLLPFSHANNKRQQEYNGDYPQELQEKEQEFFLAF
jgi:hypothetical protein